MVSYITPPVALGAFAAATLAGTSPLSAGLEAMRLGGVIYIAPFFFVLNPALIGEGPPSEVVLAVATALLAVFFISAALQRYIPLLGPLPQGIAGWAIRLLLLSGGILLGVQGIGLFDFNASTLMFLGLALALPALFLAARSGAAHRKTERWQ